MISNYKDNKQKLKEIIKEKGIVFQHVTLSSKIESNYYYDLKKVSFDPKGSSLIGELLMEEIAKFKAGSVGGLEMAAIPLATAAMIKSTEYGRYKKGLTTFFVRKEPKTHGLEKKIEGIITAPIVIVDDVVTTGKSILTAIDALIKEEYSVKGVVCVLEREEVGTTNVLKERGIPYVSLFKHSDFKEYIEDELKKKNSQIN